mmetsp:Transcript_119630/g.381748  ORF Transcript_119630/g.381748 Transcript_119630/m.381748 type:complete len:324 (+) Transcript_119630:62-1033(+)
MALVAADPAPQAAEPPPQIAAMVAPDETAYDLFRALRRSRASGVPCVDGRLAGGCLGPGELVLLHGESGSGKSALLRSILAAYVAGTEVREGAGHSVPAILIDTEGTFDAGLFSEVLQSRVERLCRAAGKGSPVEGCVDEALSRLLVLRPQEPIDLLRNLDHLRALLAANPRVGLLVVDSMSAWQPLATNFPRSVTPFMQESWRALVRLQKEHCVALVVANRGAALGTASSSGPWSCIGSSAKCRHLGIRKLPRRGYIPVSEDADLDDTPPLVFEAFPNNSGPCQVMGDTFEVSVLGFNTGEVISAGTFTLSDGGEVISSSGP